MTAQQLVQHNSKRINIAARGDGQATQLLGTRVFRREHAADRRCGLDASGPAKKFSDAKVQQLGCLIVRHDDVARLEVTMNNQVLVRELNRRADLTKELNAF